MLGDLRQDGQNSCIDQRISNDVSYEDTLAFSMMAWEASALLPEFWTIVS